VFPLQAFERCEEEHNRIRDESEMDPVEDSRAPRSRGRSSGSGGARTMQDGGADSGTEECSMKTRNRRRVQSPGRSPVRKEASAQRGAQGGSWALDQGGGQILHQEVSEKERCIYGLSRCAHVLKHLRDHLIRETALPHQAHDLKH
jgi:hypothetical protein